MRRVMDPNLRYQSKGEGPKWGHRDRAQIGPLNRVKDEDRQKNPTRIGYRLKFIKNFIDMFEDKYSFWVLLFKSL